VDEPRSLRDAWVAGRFVQSIEAIAYVAHEAMAVADDVRTSEVLEAPHAARSPFEMAVVALDSLLLCLPGDMLRFRHDSLQRGRVRRCLVRRKVPQLIRLAQGQIAMARRGMVQFRRLMC